jgi:hypothetical protein
VHLYGYCQRASHRHILAGITSTQPSAVVGAALRRWIQDRNSTGLPGSRQSLTEQFRGVGTVRANDEKVDDDDKQQPQQQTTLLNSMSKLTASKILPLEQSIELVTRKEEDRYANLPEETRPAVARNTFASVRADLLA